MADGDQRSEEVKRRLRGLGLGIGPASRDSALLSGEGTLAADGADQPGHSLAQWLAHRFNHNFTDYDRAIDRLYNVSHVGGSHYHHLLDGQHTVWGAFHAVQHVHVDDGWLTHMGHALEHLARDTMSVAGI